MPITEQCVQGARNEARIDGLEKAVEEIKISNRVTATEIKDSIQNLTNHWSKRPPWLVVGIITALTNAVTMLSAYVLLK